MKQKTIFLIGLIIVIGFAVPIYLIIQNQETPITQKPSVAAGFHSPNKYQEDYGFGYQVNNIGVEVFEGDSSYNADQTPKQYGFNIWYTNSLNQPVSYPVSAIKALDIGCIAANNQTYKQVPGIFNGSLGTGTISFAPFEVKKISISIAPNCQWAGTLDGKYWWNVPQYGQ